MPRGSEDRSGGSEDRSKGPEGASRGPVTGIHGPEWQGDSRSAMMPERISTVEIDREDAFTDTVAQTTLTTQTSNHSKSMKT